MVQKLTVNRFSKKSAFQNFNFRRHQKYGQYSVLKQIFQFKDSIAELSKALFRPWRRQFKTPPFKSHLERNFLLLFKD
jgi:hypothetical protein